VFIKNAYGLLMNFFTLIVSYNINREELYMKRKTALFLAIAAMTASSAITVFGETNWYKYDANGFAIEYNIATGEVRAEGYKSKTTDTAVASTTKFIDLTIPSEIEATKIQAISDRAFTDYDEIQTVSLPSTVTSIGDKAFWGADSFSKIAMPKSLLSIGNQAFESCDSLANVTFNSGLLTIGDSAFKNCKQITSITIPNSVTSIGANAFENCKSATTITLGDSLDELGGGAFKGCSSVKSITVPSGVTTLKSNTFEGCTSLEKVVLPDGLKSIENTIFSDCKALKQVYVPATVKSISKTAFDGAENVTFYCKNGSYAQQYAKEHNFPVITGEEIISDDTVPDHITVIVNGETVDFGNSQPVNINGRVLVPMRDIFEALGLVVGWNQDTKTATGKKGVTDISITIGAQKMLVNGKEVKIDVPAQIIDGSTMVPLRAITDSAGGQVKWDQLSQTATITN
jgi:hypothetical protein